MSNIRYIIRGLIDGSLSVLGVVIGAYNPDVSIIISAGIAGSVANGFSNVLGAFSAEHAIGHKSLRDLEESLLTSLKDTHKEHEINKIVRSSAVWDGAATFIGGLIPLAPFFLVEGFLALIMSFIITLFLFIGLGIYIARLSKKNILFSCLKMVIFATVTGLVCFSTRYIIR